MIQINSNHLYNMSSASINTYFINFDTLTKLRERLFDTSVLNNLKNHVGDYGQLIHGCLLYPFNSPPQLLTNSDLCSYRDIYIGSDTLEVRHPDEPIIPPLKGYLFVTPKTPYWIRFDFNKRMFGDNFINYTPYTKVSMYVPFYGYVDIDNYIYSVYDLHLLYSIDFSTGTASFRIYYVDTQINQDETIYSNDHILFEDTVQLGMQVPIASMDTTFYRNLAVNIAKSAIQVGIGAVAFGMGSITAGTAMTAGAVNTTTDTMTQKSIGSSGRLRTSDKLIQSVTTETSPTERKYNYTTHNPRLITYAANNLVDAIGNGFELSTNGTIKTVNSPNTVFSSIKYPYIRIYQKRVYYPINFGHQVGFLCSKSYKLKQLKGYNVIGACHIDISALKSEVDEIEELLKSGVILNNIIDTPTEQDYYNYYGYKEPFIPKEAGSLTPIPPPTPVQRYLTPVAFYDAEVDEYIFRITSYYGEIRQGVTHKGIDLTGKTPGVSLPIHALTNGKIYWGNNSSRGYYALIYTDALSSYQYRYYYCHMTEESVDEYRVLYPSGTDITKGTIIGMTGMTGNATGIHLHLEVQRRRVESSTWVVISPAENYPYLPNEIGTFNGYLPS